MVSNVISLVIGLMFFIGFETYRNMKDNPEMTVKVWKIEIDFVEGKAIFILAIKVTALLSSNSREYEEGAAFSDFKLIFKWVDDEVEYTFGYHKGCI